MSDDRRETSMTTDVRSMIRPWTRNVTSRNVGSWRDGEANCWGCKQAIGEAHKSDCMALKFARESRHVMIATAHIRCSHPLALPHTAEIWFDLRNQMIEEMKAAGDYDRDVVQKFARERRPGIDEAFKRNASFYHLDEGWDSKGWRPSMIAAFADCLAETYR